MRLREAIIEQWKERSFEIGESHAEEKIEEVEEYKNTSDLLCHCMSIDDDGLKVIAEKIGMPYSDFSSFLQTFIALDQGCKTNQ